MKPRFNFVTTFLVAFSICFAFQLAAQSEMARPASAEMPTAEQWLASIALTELRVHPEALTFEHARDGRRIRVSERQKMALM